MILVCSFPGCQEQTLSDMLACQLTAPAVDLSDLLICYCAGVELPHVDYDNLRNALITNCIR